MVNQESRETPLMGPINQPGRKVLIDLAKPDLHKWIKFKSCIYQILKVAFVSEMARNAIKSDILGIQK